ncbi:MAG: hypothetical protein N0E37_17565 [Candidatus Thiodiazotropha taylori]|nr:hypothetical protein [Candidatus Thiodiazotropha taylori]MCW4246250.1 hypothetical protein [Candidatus Thiodiazotropha taylori]
MINTIEQKAMMPFTLLDKHSPYHPSKRGKELERFGQPDFQTQLELFVGILLEGKPYPVQVYQGDDLATALFRSIVSHRQSSATNDSDWNATDAMWSEQTGLARRQIDRVRQSLMDQGSLKYQRRGFPAKSFYRYQTLLDSQEQINCFPYWPGLSGYIGYKPAALFCWLADLDKQLKAQGYFFHLKMADIQQSLGLTRYQVDQAREKLIKHDLLKERFWGIPAVREFRLRLDGLEQLVAEKGASE